MMGLAHLALVFVVCPQLGNPSSLGRRQWRPPSPTGAILGSDFWWGGVERLAIANGRGGDKGIKYIKGCISQIIQIKNKKKQG